MEKRGDINPDYTPAPAPGRKAINPKHLTADGRLHPWRRKLLPPRPAAARDEAKSPGGDGVEE